MDEIEVPQYFMCPISLQIMKDPVTTTTGITFDRDSIEQWLFTNNSTTCPITRHPLPKNSHLTPNHTLLRLIQAWCTQNGIHSIPTPKPPLDNQVLKLLKDLKDPKLQLKNIKELKFLASQNERNNKCLLQAGVPKAMILFMLTCFRKGQFDKGLEEALSLLQLQLIDMSQEDTKLLLAENNQILDSLTWVLGCEVENSLAMKSHAVALLNTIMQKASSGVMERLKPELFERIVKFFRCGTCQQRINAALRVMLSACHWGRNRIMMVESGAGFELVEIGLGTPEKSTTELTMEILFYLCSCADGRAEFVSHKGAIALLTERIFTVSQNVDERAVFILSLVSKFSATRVVLQEMVEVGTVSKLCRLVQSDHHGTYLKDKAGKILKSHADVWKCSPCISDRDRSFYANMLSEMQCYSIHSSMPN
ncbi:E3 ubiquitin-protein ligase PUB24 [Cajanus cajan]|uniref:U-box domain-containing protein n=1 Tax=Cajanus cajan TaxID=3821 RepID=A0A151SQA4_CAJCA|nr:E3 ubiquitin-protein ligase PUB24 [Cajanus cajan]KYP56948.1 U-box domain-containing protein 24 [Cajanus cajan]